MTANSINADQARAEAKRGVYELPDPEPAPDLASMPLHTLWLWAVAQVVDDYEVREAAALKADAEGEATTELEKELKRLAEEGAKQRRASSAAAMPTPPARAPRLAMTSEERRAITAGLHRRARKHKEPWSMVAEQLRAEWVSRDFLGLVARLVEDNVLHSNGQVPSALDRGDTKQRVKAYRDLLELHEKQFSPVTRAVRTKRARELVALDLCMEDYGLATLAEIPALNVYRNTPAMTAREAIDAFLASSEMKAMKVAVESACENDGGQRRTGSRRVSPMVKLLDDVRRARLIEPGEE